MKNNILARNAYTIPLALIAIACTPTPEKTQQSSQDQAMQALLDQGIEFDLDAYLQYVARGDLEVTKLFLQSGMDVEGQLHPESTTALSMISSSRSPEMVRFLLENGADPDGGDGARSGPILGATLANDLEVAEMLLDAGANPNAAFNDSNIIDDGIRTALMIAADRGHLEMAKLLVDRGARIDTRNEPGETALSLATQNDHTEIIEFLQTAQQVNAP